MATRKPFVKVIPDSLFHQLWNEANKSDDMDSFVRRFTFSTSEDRISFSKYDIDEMLSFELLKMIWTSAHLSFKDILLSNNIKKSEISHFFCIPIRTLEDWYAGKNPCPAYIRLMFIRHFHIPYLPARVTLSTISANKKAIQSFKASKKTNLNDEINPKSVMDYDDDDFMKLLDSAVSHKTDASTFEQPASSILAKTDYLNSIIKK